jgi:chorismate mutase
MSTLQEDLMPLREQINSIDAQLLELFTQRGLLSLEVGEIKRKHDPNLKNIRNRERELEIINSIVAQNKGPFSDEQLTTIFELIFEEHRELQQGLKND